MGVLHMTKPIQSSMLSDTDIKYYFGDEIDIYINDPIGAVNFDLESQLQLASIDLHFRYDCKRFKNELNGNLSYERLKNHDYTEPFEVSGNEKLVVQPGEVIFTTTMETVVISKQFAGIITGRSSIARLGIMVHCCQEFINPGQKAPIALQITNLGKHPVELDITIPICQLVLFKLSSPSSQGYNEMEKSKYRNEQEPMSSQIYKDNDIINHNSITNNITKKKPSKKKGKINWAKVKNFISPFLVPIITCLILNPTMLWAQNNNISAIVGIIEKLHISSIILVVAIIIYIICRRGEKK